MNSNDFEDLKQFIQAKVSQSEDRLRNEIAVSHVTLRQKIEAGFAAMREAIDSMSDDSKVRGTYVSSSGGKRIIDLGGEWGPERRAA
jgi:hypothetical protein